MILSNIDQLEVIGKRFDQNMLGIEIEGSGRSNLDDPNSLVRWFRGPENCELFLVLDKDNPDHVKRFNLSFFGNYVEGGEGVSLRSGQILEEEFSAKAKYKGSNIVQFEKEIPEEFRVSCRKFLENIEQLDVEIREQITAYF